jgi:hypothetical protein
MNDIFRYQLIELVDLAGVPGLAAICRAGVSAKPR